ncbi:homoserine/homoserine lactone efflux protein [Bacterioplanoides sp.]|uniref:homoserine/homoserine lactone efflux protein n=1 Tax=Bacterioplanoides sp. TaxID=2066072 RepID=UPI003B59785F
MALEVFLAFLAASILISVSPGAGAVNTMSTGLRYGVKGALPAIMGLQLGYGVQVVLVGVGLGALLSQSQLAFELIKWFGVLYLVYLGYQKWTQPPLEMELLGGKTESSGKQFWQAAFVNLTNPKATVFLLALFPQFVNPNADNLVLQYSIMGSILIIVDVLVMIGYASLASGLSRWMKSEQHQKLQNRIFGGMFVAAAGLMASYSNKSA